MNSALLSSLSADDQALCKRMCECGQEGVLGSFSSLDQVTNFLSDIKDVERNYPGGVAKYIESAKELIYDSTLNRNPFEGFQAEIPNGENLKYGTKEFKEFEQLGKDVLQHCGFALVGGGIGERLKSKYIKLSLTSDLVRDFTYLEDYCKYFRAIEEHFGCEVPFAIMTSDGTHHDTVKMLEEHHYYGLNPEKVTVMKQNGVPAINNTKCEIAVDSCGHVVFKPHGHGDIHILMSQYQIPEKWEKQGIKYVVFFQDTNGLSMHGYAPLLGVAKKYDFDFCSMAIIRKAGEKVGGICKLVKESGESLTCNVEYNQLEGVLKASLGEGDVANAQGNSNYPGNVNLLCIKLSSYKTVLKETGGVVKEFVNPKYKDATRTAFLSPVRLECMMQDYPKLLMKHQARVGFVSLPRWLCFSAVKNSDDNAVKQSATTGYPESFFSGEEDIYKFYRRVARGAGVSIGDEEYDCGLTSALGIPRFPLLAMTSRCGLTTYDLADHFGEHVTITDRSVVLLDGPAIRLENVVVDGALEVHSCKGATVVIRDCTIKNEGWKVESVDKLDPSVENKFALRGYEILKRDTRLIRITTPGTYVFTY